MKTRRVLAGLLVLAPVLLGSALIAEPAQARTIGGVAWSPAKGDANTPISITTEHGCDAGTSRVSAVVYGAGLPKDGQVVVAPSTLLMSTSRSMTLPISNAFVVYAERNSTPLVGTYQVKVRCTDRFGVTSLGDFVTSMTWKTPGGKLANVEKATYVAKNTADVKPVALPDDSGLGALPPVPSSTPSPANPGTTPNPTPSGGSTPTGSAASSPDASAGASTGAPSLPSRVDASSAESATSNPDRSWWLALAAGSAAVLIGGAWWLVRQRRTST